MTTNSPSKDTSTPSTKRLLQTLVATLFAAAVILVTIVLPAEYGLDPTGVGGLLGLDKLRAAEGEAMVEPMVAAEGGAAVASKKRFKSETVEIQIGAHEEIEHKMSLGEGQTALYSWTVDQGTVYSDFHAEPFNDLNSDDLRYEEADGISSAHGAVRAPFAGRHGWYWRNDNDFPIKITLELSGYYTEHKELYRAPTK